MAGPTDLKLGGIYPDKEPQHGQQSATANGQRLQVGGGTAIPLINWGVASIRALPDNAGAIYVGGSTVDNTNGMILQPEEDISGIHVADLSYYYVYVVNNGDGFCWLAEVIN